jgi:hypothetical protein
MEGRGEEGGRPMIATKAGFALGGFLLAVACVGCSSIAPATEDVCDFSSLARYFESADWSWTVVDDEGLQIRNEPMSVSFLPSGHLLALTYRKGACCLISEGREPQSIVATDIEVSRDPRREMSTSHTSTGHITNGVVTWTSPIQDSAGQSIAAPIFRKPWILEEGGVRIVDAVRIKPSGDTVLCDIRYIRTPRRQK